MNQRPTKLSMRGNRSEPRHQPRRDRPQCSRAELRRGSAKLLLVLALFLLGGIGIWIGRAGAGTSGSSSGSLDLTWGKRGVADGRLQKPRAAAIDENDRIYIVDKLARIQVFDTDGNLLLGPIRTPESKFGKPTGLTIDPDGNLMVADTHYYRILYYSPEGKLLEDRTLGGKKGQGPGEFGLVTDAVVDSAGNTYVCEYGDFDRVQKFSPEGKFITQWGGHGEAPGQFRRPQNMTIDEQDRLWVVDACNHRVQVFDTEGKLLKMWGTPGTEPGQLSYPYDIVLADDIVYICEYGNHRVQKFTREGKSLGCWGGAGHGEGELHNPWALVRDSQERLHVIDTNHHRVQRVLF